MTSTRKIMKIWFCRVDESEVDCQYLCLSYERQNGCFTAPSENRTKRFSRVVKHEKIDNIHLATSDQPLSMFHFLYES